MSEDQGSRVFLLVGTNLGGRGGDQGSRTKGQGDRYRFLRWWEGVNGRKWVMNGRKGSKKGVINVCI